jgi:hypothetical protein
MKSIFVVLALLILAGCVSKPIHINDNSNIDRDGTSKPIRYLNASSESVQLDSNLQIIVSQLETITCEDTPYAVAQLAAANTGNSTAILRREDIRAYDSAGVSFGLTNVGPGTACNKGSSFPFLALRQYEMQRGWIGFVLNKESTTINMELKKGNQTVVFSLS